MDSLKRGEEYVVIQLKVFFISFFTTLRAQDIVHQISVRCNFCFEYIIMKRIGKNSKMTS